MKQDKVVDDIPIILYHFLLFQGKEKNVQYVSRVTANAHGKLWARTDDRDRGYINIGESFSQTVPLKTENGEKMSQFCSRQTIRA